MQMSERFLMHSPTLHRRQDAIAYIHAAESTLQICKSANLQSGIIAYTLTRCDGQRLLRSLARRVLRYPRTARALELDIRECAGMCKRGEVETGFRFELSHCPAPTPTGIISQRGGNVTECHETCNESQWAKIVGYRQWMKR